MSGGIGTEGKISITTAGGLAGMMLGQVAAMGLKGLASGLTTGGAMGGLIGAGVGFSAGILKEVFFGENVTDMMDQQIKLLNEMREIQKRAIAAEAKGSPQLMKALCSEMLSDRFLDVLESRMTLAGAQLTIPVRAIEDIDRKLEHIRNQEEEHWTKLKNEIIPRLIRNYLDNINRRFSDLRALNQRIVVKIRNQIEPTRTQIIALGSEPSEQSLNLKYELWNRMIRADSEFSTHSNFSFDGLTLPGDQAAGSRNFWSSYAPKLAPYLQP
jgi:hypothetical protein